MIRLYVVAFTLGLLELFGLTAFSTIMEPHWFNPAIFGTGFATIIGATGAVHICHGRWGQPPIGGQ